MPGYLIDTQTIAHWFDGTSGRFPFVKAHADQRAADSPLYVSSITLGEISYGHASNPAGAGSKRKEFLEFVRTRLPQVLEISRHTAEPYGRVRARLVERFVPRKGWGNKRRAEQLYDPVAARELGIDENDLWLVAQAIERNLVFVSADNMAHIEEVVRGAYRGFRTEDWSTMPPDNGMPLPAIQPRD